MTELRVYATGIAGGVPMAIYWILLLVFCVGAVCLLWRKGMREGLRYSSLLLLAEWMVLVLAIAVVLREKRAEYCINLIPFSSYFDYGENSYLMEKAAINILNVVLFVPVGFLAGCGFREMTWRQVMVIGIVLSVTIEVLQLIFKRGLCEVDDVIHNVFGCMIGYGMSFLLTRFSKS